LQVFGELDKLDQILDLAHDPIGLVLSDQQLPQRVRPPRKHTDSMRNTQAKDRG
jgi:hypothetical protein